MRDPETGFQWRGRAAGTTRKRACRTISAFLKNCVVRPQVWERGLFVQGCEALFVQGCQLGSQKKILDLISFEP